MTFVLGVDGGGTQTRCVVLDEHGKVIGFGSSGASKPDAVEPEVGRHNLHRAILTACEGCGGADAVASAFIGMGGVVSPADVEVVRHMLDGVGFRPDMPLGIDHDIRIALAGGTAGKPGIAVIVGTGSSCYGRNAAGDSCRTGGWGYIMDDVGSAFYLGQQALMAVVRSVDHRGPATSLLQPVMQALNITDINQVMNRIYHPRLDHASIAALARTVTQVAEDDEIASGIIERGCAGLAEMVEVAARQLRMPPDVIVVPVGSLVEANPLFREKFEKAVRAVLPSARIQAPLAPPVVGAALLALERIGLSLSEDTLRTIHNV